MKKTIYLEKKKLILDYDEKTNKILFQIEESETGRSYQFEVDNSQVLEFVSFLNESVFSQASTWEIGLTQEKLRFYESKLKNYEYKTLLSYKFLASLQGAKSKEKAEVFIGLPQEEIDIFTIEEIQNACGDFMEALGFELETKDEPVYGSFFQRLKFILKDEKTQVEVSDLYKKGKQALEHKFLSVPAAEATEKLSNAACNLIAALDKVEEGVLRLGAILVVKVQKDGKPIILAETVSPELMSTFDNNPVLLKNPKAIYELLVGDKKGQGLIGEGEASEAV